LRPQIVIVGDGGHARVVIDVIEAAGDYEIAGFTSPPASDGRMDGYRRLGDDDALPALLRGGIGAAFVALGDNALRARVFKAIATAGFHMPALVHPGAIVSRRARVGDGTVVMPGAVINTGTIIGSGAIVNTGATIDHDCSIGDFVHIAPGCHLAGTVAVGEGSFLGVGTSVIPETRIGAWTVIGAGAAVVNDLDDRVLAVGVPARANCIEKRNP
jgi:UDP-perosamine 4-acetyltransferase